MVGIIASQHNVFRNLIYILLPAMKIEEGNLFSRKYKNEYGKGIEQNGMIYWVIMLYGRERND